jgi:hypothetical protein
MEDINDYVSSPYIIRRKLAELRKLNGESHFEYWVNDGSKFRVRIYTRDIQDIGPDYRDKEDRIVHHSKVTVNVYDVTRGSDGFLTTRYIDLHKDPRFCNYQPIQYKQYGNSDGQDMPLSVVCELIRYLHKLTKLSAFA